MPRRLARLVPAVLFLALSTAAGVAAQTPAPAPAPAAAPAPAIADWVGTWKGPFVYGTITLTIVRDGDAWKATCLFEGEGLPPAEEVRMWSIQGNAFSWVQTVGEYDVFVKGVYEGGVLKGSLEAYAAGAMVGSDSFQLKKEP